MDALVFIVKVVKTLEMKEVMAVVYFDIRKAYDTMWREGLFIQLEELGVGGHLFVRDNARQGVHHQKTMDFAARWPVQASLSSLLGIIPYIMEFLFDRYIRVRKVAEMLSYQGYIS